MPSLQNGFTDPHIYEYDTLTSLDRWNEHADVILANPPFMSPKGGIKPHNRFGVQSKRSEVLFVDYIAEHLTPNGRAGVIVPEGIIFQSQNAYKQLRKLLVEDYLVAVVSLPAGVFNPYSGVKTSILILDKALAKRAQTIAFFKVENDGFNLGAQRRPIDKDDLPRVRAELMAYLEALRSGVSGPSVQSIIGQIVPKEKIAANGDYNLSGERYREGAVSNTAYPLVPVARFMKEGVKTVDPRNYPDEIFELWSIPAFDAGKPELLRGEEIGSQNKVVAPSDVLLSRIIPHIRRGWVVRENSDGRRQIASTEWIVFSSEDVLPVFLRQLLVSDFFHASFMQTLTGVGGSLSRANPKAVGEIRIPLPPLDVQKEIVAEIEGYQKVIDGARAVIDSYRPHIAIHPNWPMVELGSLFQTKSGTTPSRSNAAYFNRGTIPWVKTLDLVDGPITATDEQVTDLAVSDTHLSILPVGTVLIAMYGGFNQIGRTGVLEIKAVHNQAMTALLPSPKVNPYFLNAILVASKDYWRSVANSTRKDPNITKGDVLKFELPLPSIATQLAIVAEIEAEQALVNANRELIARMEKKIQTTLARVWGEDAPPKESDDREAA